MKFFIDTANLDQIREAYDMGVLDGVTTNPSLMAKEGIKGVDNQRKHYVEICNIVQGDVSAEVIATDYEGMIKEGEELAALNPSLSSQALRGVSENRMGLIKPIPRGYIILEDSFLLNTEKTCEDIVYNTIYKHCLDKGAVPPNRHEFNRKGQSIECEGLTILTPAIFSKWSMHIQEANKKKEPLLKFNEYIRDVLLPNRFPTLPEEPHWEYFKKAILNIKPKQSPSKQWCSTL